MSRRVSLRKVSRGINNYISVQLGTPSARICFTTMLPFATWIRLLRGVFSDVFYCLSFAGLPTLKAVWNKPSLIFKPRQLSQAFMAKVWEPFGDGIDQNSRQEKEDLILPWATGVVFEIGAGMFGFAFAISCLY